MVALAFAMLVAGAAWLVFISLVSALVQTLAPDWVPGPGPRGLLARLSGRLAAGGGLSGTVASRAGIQAALLCARLSGSWRQPRSHSVGRLPDTTVDVSPWNHWRMPAIVESVRPDLDEGPVLVTADTGSSAIRSNNSSTRFTRYGRVRRRDGAFRWGVYADLEEEDRYVETFLVSSWVEHLRQHERSTNADREAEERLRSHVLTQPIVRHLVFAEPHGSHDDEDDDGV